MATPIRKFPFRNLPFRPNPGFPLFWLINGLIGLFLAFYSALGLWLMAQGSCLKARGIMLMANLFRILTNQSYETLRGSKKGNSFFWPVIYWLINGFIGNPGCGRKTRFLNGNFLIGVAIHPNSKKNGGKHTNFLRRIQCIPLRLKVYG
jgi:hypothetical protein